MADIATLTVTIDGSAAEATAKRMGATLDDLGTKGDAAAAKVKSAGDKITDSLIRQAQQARQAATVNDQVLRTLVEMGGGADAVTASLVRANGGWARYREIQQQIQQELRASDALMAKQAAALANTETASGGAISGLGRLRQGFASLAAQATGTSPIIDRIGSTLGSFAIGNVEMIAILAGIAAVSYAWKKLGNDADELGKKVGDAMKHLREESINAQVALGDLQLAKARADVAAAQLGLTMAQKPTYGAAGAKTGIADDNSAAIADAKAVLDAANAELFLAGQKKSEIDFQINNESRRSYAEGLALLVGSNNATAAERRRALDLLKSDQTQIAVLGKSQTDNGLRANLIRDAEALKGAFEKSTKQSPDATKSLSEARNLAYMVDLDNQRVAAAKALDVAAQQSRAEYDKVLHTQELERQILEAQHKILLDHLDVHGKIRAGEAQQVAAEQQAVADQIRSIDTINQHAQAALAIDKGVDKIAILKAQIDAYNGVGAAVKDAAVEEEYRMAIVAASSVTDEKQRQVLLDQAKAVHDLTIQLHGAEVARHAQDEADKQAAEATKQRWLSLVHDMQRTMTTFFENIFKGGVSSFRDLFAEIKSMFLKLIAEMLAAKFAQRMAGVLAGVLGGLAPAAAVAQGSTPGGSAIPNSAFGLNANASSGALAYGGAAIGGFGAGYGIGSATGSSTIGALGGAATGALIGNAILPGVGAVVGGLAGLAGGLFGAAGAARKAAKEARDLQAALAINFAAYKAQITGDTLGAALAQAQAGLIDILKQIDAALPGKKNEAARNQERADAQALEAKQEQQIRTANAAQLQASSTDLQVRLLRARGLTQEADALALANQQQQEYGAAVAANASATYLATLAQVQAAEKAQQAAGAIDAVTESLTNVPTGFKLAKAVFDATIAGMPTITPGADAIGALTPNTPTPLRVPFQQPSLSAPTGAQGPGSTITITGPINFTSSAANADTLFEEFSNKLHRLSLRGGATRFTVATR